MVQKILIDADPGIGDAVAIALALVDPDVDVVGVTACCGVVSEASATHNLQAIVDAIDPPKRPRIGHATAELDLDLWISRDCVDMRLLNGTGGLGDSPFPTSDLHHRHEAAKLMVELARNHPYELTIVTLGPLTNVAMAIDRAPDFLDLIKGIVCQCGSIAVGGDITAAAEFNVFAHPEAARTVLGASCTPTIVPLDVCVQPVLTFEQFTRLEQSASNSIVQFFNSILPFGFRAHHEHLGLEGFPLREVSALASVTNPRLFSSTEMAVNIEIMGDYTRGATVFERRSTRRSRAHIDVVTEVDSQGVIDYLSQVVRTA